MDKKEKYITYILDDLIKKSDIDYKMRTVKFPFYIDNFFWHFRQLSPTDSNLFLSEYLVATYGSHKDEIGIIELLFKKRVLKLIDE
jgi:hypothetical protein